MSHILCNITVRTKICVRVFPLGPVSTIFGTVGVCPKFFLIKLLSVENVCEINRHFLCKCHCSIHLQ